MLTLEYKGRKITIMVSTITIDRIIDAIYPNKGIQGVSKGYIELLKFFSGE